MVRGKSLFEWQRVSVPFLCHIIGRMVWDSAFKSSEGPCKQVSFWFCSSFELLLIMSWNYLEWAKAKRDLEIRATRHMGFPPSKRKCWYIVVSHLSGVLWFLANWIISEHNVPYKVMYLTKWYAMKQLASALHKVIWIITILILIVRLLKIIIPSKKLIISMFLLPFLLLSLLCNSRLFFLL